MKLNLNHIHFSISFLSITGSLLFTIGSIFYLPNLYSLDPNLGGALFLIGSLFFYICDILNAIAEPQFSPLKPLDNAGSLIAMLTAMGNILFIIGSVFFLPAFPNIGGQIFALGSALVIIPQILTCFGLYSQRNFFYRFYHKLQGLKRPLLFASMIITIGCLMYIVGIIFFKIGSSEISGLQEGGAGLFIGGSLLFLIVSVIGAWYRHKELEQEKEDIDTILQACNIRP